MENKEAYKTHFKNLEEMSKSVGKELGVSNWIEISQEKIDLFAKVTEDEQWIHIDKDKSKKHSPYKTTIAHGFMILSLASRFSYDTLTIENVKMGVNYGLDRVRFTSATPSGGKVRGRVSLLEFEIKTGGAKYKLGITVELEGQEKPVCVAETLAIAYE
ncbi:MaoC family dehydratase [Flavobacteriaceae bacterium]|jgi:acyl dehydratase|nr:MaoC family dehydratase [Flavobacteriaceae bacterium]|tara:strand:+ start:2290 stop:2766 length:477 start_codon:yes stop_codon:yes gene_type:complete